MSRGGVRASVDKVHLSNGNRNFRFLALLLYIMVQEERYYINLPVIIRWQLRSQAHCTKIHHIEK